MNSTNDPILECVDRCHIYLNHVLADYKNKVADEAQQTMVLLDRETEELWLLLEQEVRYDLR